MFVKEFDARIIAGLGSSFAAPFYIVPWLVFDDDWPTQTPVHAILSIIYPGVFGSASGFML